MDRSQVWEIYTLSRCRMGIIHVGHYDANGSKRIHQARRYQVKVEWQIKESTTLKKVHVFLAGANIDESFQNLIRLNQIFYRFMYSTLCTQTGKQRLREVGSVGP